MANVVSKELNVVGYRVPVAGCQGMPVAGEYSFLLAGAGWQEEEVAGYKLQVAGKDKIQAPVAGCRGIQVLVSRFAYMLVAFT